MDATTKRKRDEQVRRLVSKLLAPFGLARTKPTYWTRPRESVVEFVHLHLYTFGPVFRIHLGIHVLNDPRDFVALNGPQSTFWQDKGKFHFADPSGVHERSSSGANVSVNRGSRGGAILSFYLTARSHPWTIPRRSPCAPAGTGHRTVSSWLEVERSSVSPNRALGA